MIRTVFVMSLFTYTPLNLSFVLGFLALLSANGTRITLWNSMRIRLGLLLLFAKLILKKFFCTNQISIKMTRLPLTVIKVQIPTAVVLKAVHYLLVVQYLFTETNLTLKVL